MEIGIYITANITYIVRALGYIWETILVVEKFTLTTNTLKSAQ